MYLDFNMIFVRHPESVGNVMTSDERAELTIPNHEYPLTDRGVAQAVSVGRYLKRNIPHYISHLFCSDFKRTQDGLRIIIDESGLNKVGSICSDSRLNEKWDGIFHELTKQEIEKRYPDQILLRKRSGAYHYRAPGGENVPDVEMRIRSLISDWSHSTCKGYRLVVGHGRWFQIFQKLIHEMTVEEFLEYRKVSAENCSITIYERGVQSTDIKSLLPKSVVPWLGEVESSKNEYA